MKHWSERKLNTHRFTNVENAGLVVFGVVDRDVSLTRLIKTVTTRLDLEKMKFTFLHENHGNDQTEQRDSADDVMAMSSGLSHLVARVLKIHNSTRLHFYPRSLQTGV